MTRREEILDVAESLLESEGAQALTMRRVAQEMGIRAPSLYKHVPGKDDIEAGLQERALRVMATALAPAGTDLLAIMARYREWALTHPGLYELATRRPLRRDVIPASVEAAAAAQIVAVAGGEHRARALWALAHGLVDLEMADRFPPGADLDETWRAAFTPFR
ncbi:TetR family transcriptional regulator [Actinophytocola xinjiangensis]|uniref:TetR family transcriptional regulator n=1 Tax=Actinophytocola xinjiangensis TaxID=485602 RepID=A0A7Z1B0Z6_9PSEU|nr:TetR/AcrR family transcriptional regulator [Actinophytocola xinjiangensis]OLF14155.1 TetR family transcriptional regulator [Actinophytocola xinjiangensis]